MTLVSHCPLDCSELTGLDSFVEPPSVLYYKQRPAQIKDALWSKTLQIALSQCTGHAHHLMRHELPQAVFKVVQSSIC